MEKIKVRHVGRGDYYPLIVGEYYEIVKVTDGIFPPDIYITVLCGDRKVTAHYWRFDITKEKAQELNEDAKVA